MKAPWVPSDLLSCLYCVWNNTGEESPGQLCVHEARAWATQYLWPITAAQPICRTLSCQNHLPLKPSLSLAFPMNPYWPVQLPVAGEDSGMTVSFIYSFNKDVLSTSYVSGIVLSPGSVAIDKAKRSLS